MSHKERYNVTMRDGTRITAVAHSFSEILQMFGEEFVCMIEKMDYDERVEAE